MLMCEEPDLRSPQVDPPGASSRKNKAEATCLLCLQLEQPLDCGEQKGGVHRIWVMGRKENHLITVHCCNSTFRTAANAVIFSSFSSGTSHQISAMSSCLRGPNTGLIQA